MSIPATLPWHARQWRRFAEAIDADRLHHAMLLQGPPGLGKRRFAERAAAALLCESSSTAAARPCGECRSCLLVAAGSHPDRLRLAPEEDRRIIDVGQVRERIGELSLTAHYAQRRVILVDPADALNRHAANTLLKTLEEPPGSVVFLLLSARPSSLPATVRSRCSAIRFAPPGRDLGEQWLRAEAGDAAAALPELLAWCGGAPLAALQAAEEGSYQEYLTLTEQIGAVMSDRLDAVQAAAGWRALGLHRVTAWQLRIALEAMRIKALGDPSVASSAMQVICSRLDLRRLDQVCEAIIELRSALERQLNPGDQLALEGLAVTWRDACGNSA